MEWIYLYYNSKEEDELRNLVSKYNCLFKCYTLCLNGEYKVRIEGEFDNIRKLELLWKRYKFLGEPI